MEWRERDGLRWLEAELPGARAAFTTRRGGVSQPPYDGLNLGALTDDERAAVVENRRRLAVALGFDAADVVVGHQVHAATLATHAGPQSPSPFADPSAPIPEVDGHVSDAMGLALLVFAADCVPVALAGPGGVAMLHCGWRGLAAGIVARGVAAVGATDAAIGPSIGRCCYEVGPEVLAALAPPPTGLSRDDVTRNRPVGGRVDLAGVARRLLREAGVGRIELSGLCTRCEPGLFFSHRRDAGRSGRQAGLVWRTGEGD